MTRKRSCCLTESQIAEIKYRKQAGESIDSINESYHNVSRWTIRAAGNGDYDDIAIPDSKGRLSTWQIQRLLAWPIPESTAN